MQTRHWMLCALWLQATTVMALEPDPRRWSHLPMDTHFGGIAYAHTTADIALDPVLQAEDVELEMDTWAVKYIRSFDFFGKSGRVDITQGYQEGEWTGLLQGVPKNITRSGASDTVVRFAVNLYGAPPLAGNDYRAYRAAQDGETIVGMGLAIRLPTGSYMDDKLINLGENRYAFRPQLGVVHTRGRWTAELTTEAAFYTDNDDFFNGGTREEKPLYIVHGHLIYDISPGWWVGASVGYDYGSESRVNGVDKDDRRQNTAFALNLAIPLSRTMGIKLSYINTDRKESVGLDSESVMASRSYMW